MTAPHWVCQVISIFLWFLCASTGWGSVDDNGAGVKVWENLRQLLLMKARWTSHWYVKKDSDHDGNFRTAQPWVFFFWFVMIPKWWNNQLVPSRFSCLRKVLPFVGKLWQMRLESRIYEKNITREIFLCLSTFDSMSKRWILGKKTTIFHRSCL